MKRTIVTLISVALISFVACKKKQPIEEDTPTPTPPAQTDNSFYANGNGFTDKLFNQTISPTSGGEYDSSGTTYSTLTINGSTSDNYSITTTIHMKGSQIHKSGFYGEEYVDIVWAKAGTGGGQGHWMPANGNSFDQINFTNFPKKLGEFYEGTFQGKFTIENGPVTDTVVV